MTAKKAATKRAAPAGRPAPQDHQPKRDPRGLQRLKVGGRSRLLRFDSNAIIEACDVTGFDTIQAVLEQAAMLNPTLLRALVWAGLLHEDEDLDIREVGSWLGDGGTSLSDVLVACVAAVNAALGVSSEETAAAIDAADPTRRGAGTGTRPSAPRSPQDSATPSSGD